jgi:beta-lactamase regulating signal transducer with metallopeptidase domain
MDPTKYLIISTLCLGISYVSFKMFLRNETMFLQQRLYLIVSLVISVILPLTNLRILLPQSAVKADLITVFPVLATESLVNNVQKENIINKVSDIIPYIYIIMSAALLVIIFSQILRIIWLYNVSEKTKNGRITVLRYNSVKSPFSFFNWIFIPDHLKDKEEIEKIIIHESIHASQFHSLDNLIIEIISALLWFNPFVWLMKKSLHLVHEYIADEGTLISGIEKISYQALLINQAAEGRLINFSSGFNNNLLKKRIIMMTKKRDTESRGTGFIQLFMLTITLFLAVSVLNGLLAQDIKTGNEKAKKKNEQKEPVKGITVVGYGTKPENSNEIKVIGYGNNGSQVFNQAGIKIRNTNQGTGDSINYIVDGIAVKSIENINPDSIESINVLKGDNLVIIRTKGASSSTIKIRERNNIQTSSENPILFLNGKEVSKSYFETIDPNQIESISVIKSKERIKTITGKDGDGLILIKTKSQ